MRNLIIWAIILGVGGYIGTKLYLHQRVGDGVDMAVLMMSPWAQIEYDGISSTMTGELTIDGVSIYVTGFKDEIYIKQFGIDTPSFLSLLELGDINAGIGGVPEIPEYFGFIIKGLTVPADADYAKKLHRLALTELGIKDANEPGVKCTGKYGFSPEAVKGLGYDEQVMSMRMIFRQQEQSYAVEMQADMKDAWEMDAVLTLAGDMRTELMKGSAYRPRLSNLHVEFTDNSLMDRVNKYCDRLGLTAEEIHDAQLEKLAWIGKNNGIVFDEYMIEPYEQFIAGKDTLVITARPNEPISMTHIDLYKPEDVPALLNLEASAH